MKKILFALALMAGICMTSCDGKATGSSSDVDSTAVDSTAVADSTDSVVVDSVAVDSAVVK